MMVLDSAMRELASFQAEYRSRLQGATGFFLTDSEAGAGSGSGSGSVDADDLALPDEHWGWFIERATHCSEAITAYFEPFTADPPAAPVGLLLCDIVRSLVDMQTVWSTREWSFVSILLQEIFQKVAAACRRDAPSPVAQALQSRADAVKSLAETHASFVRRDIERFVLIPLLREGLLKGRISAGGADSSLALIDYEGLLAAVEKVCQSLINFSMPVKCRIYRNDKS